MQISAGKVLASVFCDALGILLIDYLGKERTINSEYYIALLVRLKEEIAKKRPQMKKKKVLFQQDNAPCHKSIATMAKLHELHFEMLCNRPIPQIELQATTVCRAQKNAPGKEIWLWWRSDIGNWGIFWGQRQIVQQKRHRIVKEALESMYHPRRRLWWINLNFAHIHIYRERWNSTKCNG